MAKTYEQIYREVNANCPLAPILLCRSWVQNAYSKICDRQANWSWLRAESEFVTTDSRSGTCTVVKGSKTVTGVGLTFVAADTARQFRTGSGIPYSINSVNTVLNTCILDMAYQDASATATSGTILDAYITMPEDFGHFISVFDPANRWQLRIFLTDAEINLWDPSRQTTGMSFALASRRVGSTTAADGLIQYELWPYAQTGKRYPYYYMRRPEELLDSQTFNGPLKHRTDILVKAALIECARWPGVADQKNPYFNLNLAQTMMAELEQMLMDIEQRDQDIYLTWVQTVGLAQVGYPPFDAAFMQSHDFPAYSNQWSF